MSAETNHDYDPTFAIAMTDTDESDLSPEAMEAAHEAIEEKRAEILGLVPVGQVVVKPTREEIDSSESVKHYMQLIENCDNLFDLRRYHDTVFKPNYISGLITKEQYESIVARLSTRKTMLAYMQKNTPKDDGRYGKQY